MGNENLINGISTDLELEKLNAQYGEMEIGSVFMDSDIERIIGANKNGARYKTVTFRWRRDILANKNLLLIRKEEHDGFKVATHKERMHWSLRKQRSAERNTNKAVVVLGSTNTDEFDDNEKRLYEIHLNSLLRTRQFHMEEKRKRKMLPPGPVQQKLAVEAG